MTGSRHPYVAEAVFSCISVSNVHFKAGLELSDLETALNQLPQLLSLMVAWVLNLDRSTLGDDLLSSIRSASVSPS